MLRRSSFQERQAPFVGKSKEFLQHKRAEREAAKVAKQSGDEPVAKKRKRSQGGAKCEQCGKGTDDGVRVTRGRCYEHRTEESHPSCKHPGCTTSSNALKKGFCPKHGDKCMIEGCTSQIKKASMCKRHYNEHHPENKML